MNFQYDKSLATFQDSILQDLINNQEIPETTLKQLVDNYWIKIASLVAPSNLTVRHYCLIDIICNHYFNIKRILQNLAKLVYITENMQPKLWVEGYSYWLYTKPFLQLYLLKKLLPIEIENKLKNFITDVDDGFCATGYVSNGIIFPAPFGDLRYQSLENQNHSLLKERITIGPIMKSDKLYYISKRPIGFNMHTIDFKSVIDVSSDIPYNILNSNREAFKFYEGYDKKYQNKFLELKNMITIYRLISACKLLTNGSYNHVFRND